MNTTNYIRIFRGDDSDALGYQTIVGTIKTDLDLTGCKAVFRFLGFYAEFNPIPEDKKLTIVIPAQASRGFPPGVGYASLKVFDSLGKIRTFTNRIPVIVDTMTPSCGCGEFEVSFSPFPELEPLKIFVGPNADDFDQYTGFVSKIIDRASLMKYGLAILADAMSEDGGASGKAASPLAVKAAYDAIIKELVDNYYTADQTDEAIDRVAAYYITYTAAGAAFPTYAALANATTVYSGGKVRIPTRNDYCVVLADETHDNAEYRYIYAVAEGQTTGSWQPQFPVEGVMTVDQTVQKNSQNPVSGGGVWSMIWGALASLPTGFSSLYDWCVSQLAGKVPTTRTVNGKALTSDVTLTGADIAVSGTDATKIDAALAGKASTADATLTDASEWRILHTPLTAEQKAAFYAESAFAAANDYKVTIEEFAGVSYLYVGDFDAATVVISGDGLKATFDSSQSQEATTIWGPNGTTVATRTALQGYRLGPDDQSNPNRDKPLASEAEAEALRTGKANRAANPTAGDLAGLDAYGNLTDSGIPSAAVPSAATAQNPLVDTTTMNSSIATNTANFLGTYSYVTDLGFPQPSSAADVNNAAIATALGGLTFSQTPTNNDYVFVSINYTPTTDVDEFRRFKFNGTTGTWGYEYTLNNSSFTAAQWAAINSGITSGLVAKLGALPTAEALAQALAGKQDALSAQQLANIAAVSSAFAFDATRSYAAGDPVVYNGTLYTFTAAHTGAWTGSDVSAVDIIARLAGKADVSAIPYALVTKTITSGAVTLDDRAINAVAVSSAVASLTVNFPTATSGRVRDFGLRLTVASGITTAPQLVLPQGVTCENADGTAPEIGADGAATILYFTETASGVFLVKGEVVTAIS